MSILHYELQYGCKRRISGDKMSSLCHENAGMHTKITRLTFTSREDEFTEQRTIALHGHEIAPDDPTKTLL